MTKSQEKKIISGAMSILGKRMTPKRLKAIREISLPAARAAIKPRKLNAAAVKDIRLSGTDWATTTRLAKKYKVNPTTIIRTRDCIYHRSV
jgi:hypothetical protein